MTVHVTVSAVVELPAADRSRYVVMATRGGPAEALGTEIGIARYRIGSGEWTVERVVNR